MPVAVDKEYELFCRGELSEPYPFLARLRENDPVHWSDRLNSWVLTSYRLVSEGLCDYRRLSSARMGLYLPESIRDSYAILDDHIARWMVMVDRPHHTHLRRLVNKAFSPQQVQQIEPTVRQLVDDLIDAIHDGDQMDLIRDFAYPLPATVIATMLGFPHEDRDLFKNWTDKITLYMGSSKVTIPERAPDAYASLSALIDYMENLVAERRRNPKNDLTSALLAIEDEGDRLSEEEVVAMCNLLLVAGHETTTGLLGNGLMLLLQFPDQRRRLESDPVLIEPAVEEILRYESPLQRQTRRVIEEFELEGRKIKANQSLILMQGAANRDPIAFPDPDRFDIGRTQNNHVSFGRGIHLCLGAPLARMEARVAIPRLLGRLPKIRLATANFQWRKNMSFRSLTTLPVEF